MKVTGRALKDRIWHRELGKKNRRVFRNKLPVNYRLSFKNHFKIPGNFEPILGHESVVLLRRKRHFFEKPSKRWRGFPPGGLSIYLSIDLSIYLSIYLSIDVSIYLSIYLSYPILSYPILSYLSILSIYLSIYLPYLSYLAVYLSICLSICLSVYLSTYLWCSVIQCNVV